MEVSLNWGGIFGTLLVTCIGALGTGIWVYVRLTDKHNLWLNGPQPPGLLKRVEKLEAKFDEDGEYRKLEEWAIRSGYDRRTGGRPHSRGDTDADA